MGLVQCIHSSLPTPRTAIREDRKRICVAPNATCSRGGNCELRRRTQLRSERAASL